MFSSIININQKKHQVKLILKILPALTILACSNNNGDIQIDDEPNSKTTTILTLTNSSSISGTPFSKPREAIIFENNLYTINDSETFKYDFGTNTWETINTNSSSVANYPYLEYNVSFIRDNKWHIINENALWAFDFSTNNWTKIKQFTDNKLGSPIGVYSDESLYIFSDLSNKVYKYDFETNTIAEHSTFDKKSNYGQLTKSIFKIEDTYYFTKLSGYDKISIYKWIDNFAQFELLNEYQSNFIAQGSGFVFKDNIIFGLGGQSSVDENGNMASFQLNDEFYYYNTTNNEFKKIENSFYEGRYVSLPIKHNDKFYLIGGQTITNNEVIYKETLDLIDFEFIESQ